MFDPQKPNQINQKNQITKLQVNVTPLNIPLNTLTFH